MKYRLYQSFSGIIIQRSRLGIWWTAEIVNKNTGLPYYYDNLSSAMEDLEKLKNEGPIKEKPIGINPDPSCKKPLPPVKPPRKKAVFSRDIEVEIDELLRRGEILKNKYLEMLKTIKDGDQ